LNWLASEALRTGLSLELVRDIDTAAMESLKALDPNRPIRDVDIHWVCQPLGQKRDIICLPALPA